MLKRVFDILFSTGALFVLSPILLVVAFWVKCDSPGPVFFRQLRVGQHGRNFRIYKFRTMQADAEDVGPQITAGSDARITRSGKFLRKYKIDEFPQFINVLSGAMSVVGPRPEVPRYVALYPMELRELVLSVRPGITDQASIECKDESDILARAEDPEKAYVEKILPIKLRYYADYARHRSLWADFLIVVATFGAIFLRR